MVGGVSINVVFFIIAGIGAIAIGQLLPRQAGGRDLPPPPPERFGTQRQRLPNQSPRRPPPNGRDLSFDISRQNQARPELTIEGWVPISFFFVVPKFFLLFSIAVEWDYIGNNNIIFFQAFFKKSLGKRKFYICQRSLR